MFNFKKQPSFLKEIIDSVAKNQTNTASEITSKFGGSAYGGLLFIFTPADAQKYLSEVSVGFPQQTEGLTLIGYDWLGRILGINELNEQIYLFEPGTGESLQITQGLKALFTQEVVKQHDALLASSFNQDWLKSKGKTPVYGYCVGYKVPLFLGGADNITNLELVDLDVYWHLSIQLISKARDKSPGDSIQ